MDRKEQETLWRDVKNSRVAAEFAIHDGKTVEKAERIMFRPHVKSSSLEHAQGYYILTFSLTKLF